MAHARRVKATALARLLAGESALGVAEGMGIPRRTVRRWQTTVLDAIGQNGHKKEGTDSLDVLGERVADDLAESLTSAMVLVRQLGDPEYLRSLDARELAIIHGGMFDRTWRLLGGLDEGERGG
jgi:hypothetical protein